MAKKKKKLKKYVLIMSATALLAAASMVLYVWSGSRTKEPVEPEITTVTVDESNKFSPYVKKYGKIDCPLQEMSVKDVFAEIYPSGEVKFFEYRDGVFGLMPGVKDADISVKCSNQDIPVKLYYVEKDNEIGGFGLFTTKNSKANVKLYDYAFFKLVGMPEGYGSGDAMLLVDFDEEDFLSQDKSYSEVYGFNKLTKNTTKLTGDNGRLIDEYGRHRTDWAVMTDSLLKTCGGKRYYLSGRNYNLNMMDEVCDIINVPDTSTKPSVAARGIFAKFALVNDGNLTYFKKTDNGFNAVTNTGGVEKTTASFDGDLSEYLIDGHMILNKMSLVLTDLFTGESKTLDVGGLTYPVSFSVSPDKTKLVMLKNGGTQTAVLYDLKSGEYTVAEDKNIFYGGVDYIMWTTDNSFVINSNADGVTGCRICAF
ncbi:MAG: hypothetical protein K6F09_06900 [Clostridiales bacterium]|nr:hypothetical protein [Clostridiales bacterium]